MEINSEDFNSNYRFLRRSNELAVGDWDLYKRLDNNEKLLVKEIQFYDEGEAKFFIQGILETSSIKNLQGCLLKFEGYTIKNLYISGQYSLSVFLIYENYENSLDKLNSQKIKDSESFTPNGLYVLTRRIIKIMAAVEKAGCRHGDIRLGNIILGDSGRLDDVKLLWVPFGKRIVELSLVVKENLLKLFNYSPEVLTAFNALRKQKDRMTSFRVAEEGIDYLKADVYSLAIMILRLFCLYTNDNFYDFHGMNGFAKTNTKKVEKVLLSLHQLNSRLAVLLNQCLIHDVKSRPSFCDLDAVLGND